MNAPRETPDHSIGRRGVAFWLPPHGFDNGLPAAAWAEIADLSEHELPTVLLALSEARIAVYAAIVHPRLADVIRDDRSAYRIWVDTMRFRQAEDVLMEVLRPH